MAVLTVGCKTYGKLGHKRADCLVVLELPPEVRPVLVACDSGSTVVVTTPLASEPGALLEPPAADAVSDQHGFELLVEPVMTAPCAEHILSLPENKGKFGSFTALNAIWNQENDHILVDLLNLLSEKENIDWMKKEPADFKLTKDQIKQAPGLVGCSSAALRARFATIRQFNVLVEKMLPLIDLSLSEYNWSLAHTYAQVSGLVLWKVKGSMWTKALNAKQGGGCGNVYFNRLRASRFAARGLCDHEAKYTMFAQLMHQVHYRGAGKLRTSGQAWSAQFRGEGSIDAGGPYRESITNVSTELQSRTLPLLVQCPNYNNDAGLNREKWVLNPTATRTMHLAMLEFFGKLMGLALRTHDHMPLDLPSLLWKQLVGSEVTFADLDAIDSLACKVLARIKKLTLDDLRAGAGAGMGDEDSEDGTAAVAAAAQEGVDMATMTDEELQSMPLGEYFVTTLSDGTEVELKPNGKAIPVTFANRNEWVDLVVQTRLYESKRQADAIRRGLSAVVPLKLLPLLNWRELEVHVCGRPVLDVQLLKANTTYGGCNAKDEHIQFFWQVRGFACAVCGCVCRVHGVHSQFVAMLPRP